MVPAALTDSLAACERSRSGSCFTRIAGNLFRFRIDVACEANRLNRVSPIDTLPLQARVNILSLFGRACAARTQILLRKEVIQPQVPLRLPCYDFIPITNRTLGTLPPYGLLQPLRVRPAFRM